MRTCVRDFAGSAYSQFKRSLSRGNFLLAWTLAADLPRVPLADALALLLLARDQQPWRFEAAAPRWHARLCSEAPLALAEAQLALAALHALRGSGPAAGARALQTISLGPRSEGGGRGAGRLTEAAS